MTQTESVEVSGRAVAAIVDGVVAASGHFEDRTRRILADAAGIEDPSPEAWYDLDATLDAYDDLLGAGESVVERVGQHLPTAMAWSDHVDGVEAALEELPTAFRRLHRNGSAGTVRFERTDRGEGRVVFQTPYPTALEHGLVRGLARHFGTGTADVTTTVSREGSRTVVEVSWLVSHVLGEAAVHADVTGAGVTADARYAARPVATDGGTRPSTGAD